MTRTLKKNIRRSITGSLGRYIAILLIIMLGVAFFAGLRLTHPAMSATQTAYLQETQLYDLRLLSTIGFDEADVEAVSQCEGVTAAEGSVYADFILLRGDAELVYRAHALTDSINQPDLVAGRMPEADNECLLDANRFTEDMIGATIDLAQCNDEDTLDQFAYTTYTVTGLARSPLYLSADRGTTSLGSGTLTGFVLIPIGGFDTEYYTELFVKCTDEFAPYSDAYNDYVDTLSDAVEQSATLSVEGRFDDLVSDAQQEIADAEQELEDGRAEGQQKLDDAKQELDDALAELQDGQTELDDAKAQLEDGQAELDDAKAQLSDAKTQLDEAAEQLQSGYTSWEGALSAGRKQVTSGQAQLDEAISSGKAQLSDSKAQLDALEDTYASGKAQLEEGTAQYESYLAQWQAGYDQYTAALTQYEAGYAQYQAGLSQYQEAQAAFEAGKDLLSPEEAQYQEAALAQTQATLAQTEETLTQTKAQLDASSQELEAQKAQLDDSKAQLEDSAAQLETLRAGLDSGWADYNSGVAQLESQQAQQQKALDEATAQLDQFQSGINSYYDGKTEYDQGVTDLAQGQADYDQGVQDLADGWTEYNDGLAEYQDGLKDFDQEIDGEQKIADAKAELEDLDAPKLYVLNRASSNAGYATFESDSQIVSRLAGVFPIFFFLIAALVCSTTMTRMVDDDRTQIGTMRALGYSRGAILGKYLIYSGSAATVGCLIGYFGGGYLFPLVIWTAYQMLYKIPGYVLVYDWRLFVISLAASLLCSAGVTYLSCRHTMADTPADLIRPKTPAAGKRILLERVNFIWKRLKFLHKVTLRNIFRFKKRMFMMILGIAGCTALVLTALGIEDSVANIANFQFDNIQKYDISLLCDDGISEDWLTGVEDAYGDQFDTHAVARSASGELTGPDGTKTVYFVVSDDPAITEIYDLHRNGTQIPFPGDGEVVITEKLAQMTGVQVGDQVTISASDTDKAELTVSGIAENYVYNYVYMTGTTYDAAFQADAQNNTLLIRVADGGDEYALAASLSGEAGVDSVTVVTDTRNTIDQMMKSLNYVVALVLGCAAALAFIVLFNLGNINLSERVREIATIKVLGFHARETGAYVFRENIILSLMGILCGLPLGVALHAFVMSQIQVDMVAFQTVIKPTSYLLAVIIVILFAVITDQIMRRKIARIDMAESLKSIE
jgi:putative ABC transport system permease protein